MALLTIGNDTNNLSTFLNSLNTAFPTPTVNGQSVDYYLNSVTGDTQTLESNSTQIVVEEPGSPANLYAVLQGSNLSQSGGTISSLQLYSGGSFRNGSVTGGTLIIGVTVSATEYSITIGNTSLTLQGSNLPTSVADFEAIANGTYAGPNLTVTEYQLTNGASLATLIETPTAWTLTLNGDQLILNGNFPTSLTAAQINALVNGQSLSSIGLSGDITSATVIDVNNDTTLLSLIGLGTGTGGVPATSVSDLDESTIGSLITASGGNVTINAAGTSTLVTGTSVGTLQISSITNNAKINGVIGGDGLSSGNRDFNGDTYSDILFQNSATQQVFIWEMNGSTVIGGGLPGTPGTSAGTMGTGWEIVGTGDFNADGKTDILFQNAGTGQLAEWQMNGATIVNGALVGTTVGAGWNAIATGDFNGEGSSDILFQNSVSKQLYIWEMAGDTVIGGGSPGTPAAGWKVVGTGDFNGDGKADILFQNAGTGQLAEWQMNGATIVSGGIINTTVASGWNAIATGDFNGDGSTDILFQNSVSNQLYIWEMSGTTVIGGGSPGTPSTGWYVVGTGDYNGDGKSDILLQDPSTGQLDTWLMNGANTTSETLVSTTVATGWNVVPSGPAIPAIPVTPLTPAADDFNGDGKSDILFVNGATGQFIEWQVNGTSVSSNATVAQLGSNSGWSVVDLGDYNGDGKSDILLQNTGTGQITLWLMNGATISSNVTLAQLNSGWSIYQGSNLAFTTAPGTAVPQDFNGDGKSDILLQNAATGQIVEWLMNGTTISSNVTLANLGPGAGWSVVATGDFNGDGKSDILLQNAATGQINEWLMNGTTIASNQQIANLGANSGWSIAGIGDFNGDGKTDILVQNAATGQINEWLMNGTTIASNQQIANFGANSGWSVAGIGDFNGDGKSDILLQNAGTGQINLWLMNGTAIASNQQIANFGAHSGWSVAGLGDYNGDGKTDILLQNSNTGQIVDWLMNGTTILNNGALGSTANNGWTVSLHH